ncbi:MAG: BACON domain-containing protein [Bryobacterales bacterium]|nr:BACON domain-containing protein [Bryobacterales bacterium]
MSVPLQQGTGGSRFTFQSWSDGGTATHSIAALQSGTLTASFMPAYQLTTTVLPSHAGAITSSPTSSDGFFAAGSAITIAATSMLGFVFSGYSGDLSGLANPQSIAMNSPRTVTANFSCAYTITPSSTAVGSAGGNLVVTVATGAGCAWGVTNLPIWITVAAGGGGNGNGSASFSVAANTAPAPRTATFTIAGQQFMVNQAATPGCSFSLDKSSLNVLAEGASVTVSVGTSSQTCTWTAVSLDPWIVITSGAMGTGNGLATLQVFGNSASGSRSGFVNIAGQVFTINQSGTTPPTGLRFVPLRPCRLMETRPEYNFEGRIGDFGPPFMTAGTTRTLALPQSNVCSIPNTAKAFVLNVTLIPRGGVDHVTVFPGGDTRPEFYTVRSPDGQIVANSAIVKAGPGGSIQVYTTNDTDILIDISGYMTDSPTANLVFYPLAPCRVIETRAEYRSPPGPFGPPTMNTGETRRFRFPSSPHCTVPSAAAAYSVTITVVPPGPLQFLTAWPAGEPQPNISNINSPAGRVLANNVILPASADGSVEVFVFNRSDVIVDISGYFAPDNGSGLLFFPVTQCRVADTRLPPNTFGGPILENESWRTYPIPTSACGIPSIAGAYSLHLTAIPNGSPMPFLSVWPGVQGQPTTSVLNAFQGQTVTNSVIVPPSGGAISVYAFRRTHLVLEVSGYFGR